MTAQRDESIGQRKPGPRLLCIRILLTVALIGALSLTILGLGHAEETKSPVGASSSHSQTVVGNDGPSYTPQRATSPSATDPDRLVIPRIDVDASIEARPTTIARNPFTGSFMPSFGVPDDMSSISWWADGPRPSEGGMAILLGHTQVGDGYAVFNELHKLSPGDAVAVADTTGTVHQYHVSKVIQGLAKKDPQALQAALADNAEDADLALITCSGPFDENAAASTDNSIVFATAF